jgi:VanZ family protein
VGAAGAALSLTLETAQAWIPSRDSSALDVVVNTLSTIAGIWIGAAIGRLRPDGVGGKALTLSRPMPLALAAAWLVAQCFPFLPVMRVRLLRDSVAQMLRVSDLSWLNLVGAFVGCLLLSYILRVLLEKSTWRVALIVAFLVFPLRVFLQGAAVSWPYLVAAALAFGFASRAFSRPSAAGAGLLAWLALLLITVNEFYPLALADAPAPFLWTPFAGFLEANRDAAIRVVLAKFFLYGSAVWALREGGLPLWMSTGLVTVLLAVSEAAQCYLPGRVPESTDPLLALAAGVLMVWLKDRPRTRRIG